MLGRHSPDSVLLRFTDRKKAVLVTLILIRWSPIWIAAFNFFVVIKGYINQSIDLKCALS